MPFMKKYSIIIVSILTLAMIIYLIQNFTDTPPTATPANEIISEEPSNVPNPLDKIEHTNNDQHEEANSHDDTRSDVNADPTKKNTQANKSESEGENASTLSIDSLSFDMPPLHPHSVSHVTSMIEEISRFHNGEVDSQALGILLIEENYIHFKFELEQKNAAIYNALDENLSVFSSTAADPNLEDLGYDALENIEAILIKLKDIQ